jgi:parallel beta-helix repeat protein
VVNANLIMGNAAEAGSGGGIRFQGVNGSEVSTFPNNPGRWYTVRVTHNIVTNNVAGWDGGGISLQDSIGVNLINNTIASNDSTASSGSRFGAFFATQASAPTPCPRDTQGANIPCVPLSDPQPAGLSSAGHSAEFLASLPATITCPAGHFSGATAANGTCRQASYPLLYNDLFWQNRAFNIVVTQPVAGTGALQATVELVPALNQTATGDCIAPPSALSYWDIGLRGDHGPNDHASGVTFNPLNSVLTSTAGYAGSNLSSNPALASQYCNGSKRPPEAGIWCRRARTNRTCRRPSST